MSVNLKNPIQAAATENIFSYNNSSRLDASFLSSSYGSNYKLVINMFQAFLDSNESEVPRLKVAIHNVDYPSIKSITHKIKNNFYYVGLGRTSKLLAEIEKKALLHSEDVVGLYDEFYEDYDTFMEAVSLEKTRLINYLNSK